MLIGRSQPSALSGFDPYLLALAGLGDASDCIGPDFAGPGPAPHTCFSSGGPNRLPAGQLYDNVWGGTAYPTGYTPTDLPLLAALSAQTKGTDYQPATGVDVAAAAKAYGVSYVAPTPAAPAQPQYSPQLQIAAPQNPQVGDSWTITVIGAPPNSPVSVFGSAAPNLPAAANTPMGVTDANGTFQKSGTFADSTVGAWLEEWRVNNQPVGTWNFTVQPRPATPAPAPVPPPGPATAPTTVSVDTASLVPQITDWAPALTATSPGVSSFFSGTLFGFPVWAWSLGAVALVGWGLMRGKA